MTAMIPTERNKQCSQILSLCLFLLLQYAHLAAAGDMAAFPTPSGVNNTTQESLRQNVCSRYIPDGSSELRSALSGMTLRPIFTVSKFFHYSETTGIDETDPGLAALLLDELATRANFTWRDSFAVSYGPEPNQTWTEMLRLHTEMFDISVDYWDKSSERLNKGIAFLDRWFDGNMILIEKIIPPPENKKVNYTNYLRPFTATVWYVILATIVASALIYQWLEYMANGRDGRSFSQWFQDNLYLSSMNFSQNYSYEPVSPAGRLFGFSVAIWAMVLGATYTANLASLFVEQQGEPTKTQDIDEAIRLEKKLCTWAGTNSDLYIKRRYSQAMRVPKQTEMEAYEGLHTKECDLTVGAKASWEGYEMDANYNTYCDLEWVGRTIEEVSSSFAVRADPAEKCTNLVRDVLNLILSEMASDNKLAELWDAYYTDNKNKIDCATFEPGDRIDDGTEATTQETRYLKAVTSSPQPPRHLKSGGGGGAANAAAAAADDDPESSSLDISAMAGTFVLHAVLSGLAIVFSIISNFRTKFTKQNDDREESTFEKSVAVNYDTDITESSNVAGWSLASGTCARNSSDLGGVDSFVPKQGAVQEQLQSLQTSQHQLQQQQQNIAQQMTQVVSLLTNMQEGNSNTRI